MNLHEWARDWSIPHAAMADFMRRSGMVFDLPPLAPGAKSRSEASVQAACRVEAPKHGDRLWRNNVGVLVDARGVPVRFGLANDSAQANDAVKSADLVGIRRRLITADMVGQVIGQFWSREVKAGDWRFTGTARENAQLAWANHINALGGDAGFVSDVAHLYGHK